MDYKHIPIFIISYNRLSDLRLLIERLNRDGYKNIIVVDNASDDKNLLMYLKSLDCRVELLDKNYGHKVVWKSGLFDDIINNSYYVVTDPDILPTEECPSDYIKFFKQVLDCYPEVTKVGFSLKISDLPIENPFRMDVIRWESFFFDKVISMKPLLYKADIDTTFALYRPGKIVDFFSSIRTGKPYEARHLPWYWSKDNYSDEIEEYLKKGNMCGNTYSNYENIKKLNYQIIKKIYDDRTEISTWKLKMYKSYIKAHEDTYIYGAGKIGKEIAGCLINEGYSIAGFLVSKKNCNDEALGLKIYEFSEKKDEIQKSKAGIILGTTLEYKLNILDYLYSEGCTDICSIEM